jgi:hypothetical protein
MATESRLLLAVTALIGLGAIALPATIVLSPPASEETPQLDVARLQIVADEACRCSRERGTEDGVGQCWSSYERQAAPHRTGSMALACGPGSAEWDCFGDDCQPSVATDRSPSGLCSNEEREIIAAIWAHELDGAFSEAETERAYDRASAAARRAQQAFRLGQKVSVPAPPKSGETGGC